MNVLLGRPPFDIIFRFWFFDLSMHFQNCKNAQNRVFLGFLGKILFGMAFSHTTPYNIMGACRSWKKVLQRYTLICIGSTSSCRRPWRQSAKLMMQCTGWPSSAPSTRTCRIIGQPRSCCWPLWPRVTLTYEDLLLGRPVAQKHVLCLHMVKWFSCALNHCGHEMARRPFFDGPYLDARGIR